MAALQKSISEKRLALHEIGETQDPDEKLKAQYFSGEIAGLERALKVVFDKMEKGDVS